MFLGAEFIWRDAIAGGRTERSQRSIIQSDKSFKTKQPFRKEPVSPLGRSNTVQSRINLIYSFYHSLPPPQSFSLRFEDTMIPDHDGGAEIRSCRPSGPGYGAAERGTTRFCLLMFSSGCSSALGTPAGCILPTVDTQTPTHLESQSTLPRWPEAASALALLCRAGDSVDYSLYFLTSSCRKGPWGAANLLKPA